MQGHPAAFAEVLARSDAPERKPDRRALRRPHDRRLRGLPDVYDWTAVEVSTGGGPAKLYVAAPIAFGASKIEVWERTFLHPPHHVVPVGARITVEDYGNGGMLDPYSGQNKSAVYAPSGCKKDCNWTSTGTCNGEPELTASG